MEWDGKIEKRIKIWKNADSMAKFETVTWLWNRLNSRHCTTVYMRKTCNMKQRACQSLILARTVDSNCSENPSLDSDFRGKPEQVVISLFDGAVFEERTGIKLPQHTPTMTASII